MLTLRRKKQSVIFEADLLYLQPREEGVAYALEESVVHPGFNYHFGARATLGFQSRHDDWVLELQGLHFHARCTDQVQGPLLPTQTHPLRAEGTSAASATNRWRLHLGWVDLLLTRPFPWITPSFGLKFIGVRHKARINYLDLGPFADEELSMKNKFWGLGPEMALSSQWAFSEHVGIYGRAAVSLLLGQFYIHQDEEDETNRLFGRMKLLDQFWLTRGFAEGALGLFYRHCFTKSFLEIKAGYQLYLLTGQNQAIQFVSHRAPAFFVSNLGDLTLQGWSLGLLFNF